MLFSSRTTLGRFLPSRQSNEKDALKTLTRGIRALSEGVDELPIESPRDMWSAVERKDAVYLQRSFDLPPEQMKMLLCELVDAQEVMGHEIHVTVSGSKLTVRTTTHEFGEPTDRDRRMTRHIDTAYDEMIQVYK